VEAVDRIDLREALAILAAEPGDEAARAAVFDGLLRGRLLAPLAEPDPDVEQPVGVVPGELHLVAVPRDDAQPTVLCFTGSEPLARLGASGPKAVVRLPEFWQFVVERGVTSCTIDFGGPVAAVLDEGELAALAEGRVPDASAGETARLVLVAPVAPVPDAVADAVADVARRAGVRSAYVLEGQAFTDARHLVAGLDLESPEALPDVWAGLEPVATGDGWRLSAAALAPWELSLIRAAGVEAAAPRCPEPPSPA
jgi:hypothetical protein